jgi:hypothetical protein
MTEILQIPDCKIMTDCSPKATLEKPLFNRRTSEYENITILQVFNFFQHLWEKSLQKSYKRKMKNSRQLINDMTCGKGYESNITT